MSIINDNLINSIIRLRLSFELGLLDNINTTNSNNNTTITNNNNNNNNNTNTTTNNNTTTDNVHLNINGNNTYNRHNMNDSILNRMHRNNVFYNIVTSDFTDNLNGLTDDLTRHLSDNLTINLTDNLTRQLSDNLTRHLNDRLTNNLSNFIREEFSLNDMPELFLTSIITSIMNSEFLDGGEFSDNDSVCVLTETEFDQLTSSKIQNEDCDNSQCSICLDDFKINETIVFLKCKHIYHKDCIKNWLTKQSSKCPTCRTCCKSM